MDEIICCFCGKENGHFYQFDINDICDNRIHTDDSETEEVCYNTGYPKHGPLHCQCNDCVLEDMGR